MVVAIRLSRWGNRHRPFFRIVVANARSPRDGKHLERVGTYDPLPTARGDKMVSMNFDRIKYWLSVGAQPSDAVARLLGMVNLGPPAPVRASSPKAPAAAEAAKPKA
eukprot:m.90567 g.90567  ORF g.90567 m.90567 type:complete len:107 (+) comp15268_c0_seq1:41-361(+)